MIRMGIILGHVLSGVVGVRGPTMDLWTYDPRSSDEGNGSS